MVFPSFGFQRSDPEVFLVKLSAGRYQYQEEGVRTEWSGRPEDIQSRIWTLENETSSPRKPALDTVRKHLGLPT